MVEEERQCSFARTVARVTAAAINDGVSGCLAQFSSLESLGGALGRELMYQPFAGSSAPDLRGEVTLR